VRRVNTSSLLPVRLTAAASGQVFSATLKGHDSSAVCKETALKTTDVDSVRSKLDQPTSIKTPNVLFLHLFRMTDHLCR